MVAWLPSETNSAKYWLVGCLPVSSPPTLGVIHSAAYSKEQIGAASENAETDCRG
jgi:hypothetical protein